MSSYGLLADFRCPKVSKGEQREARAQWAQPPKAVSDPEFRQTTSGTHGSANRADCLPRGKPFGAPAGAYPCPWWGLTRRLRRGRRACSPMGARLLQGANRRFPKGNEGKRVSSGYNRRRRLAPRSSGKQQAGRTAVRTAPIVCPEESPQRARWRVPLSCVDTPTPRRGCRGASGKPPCLHR